MRADPDVHQRLERAAAHVGIDTQRRLDEIRGVGERRHRARRIQVLAVAAVIGILAVFVAWQLRFSDGRSPVPGATAGPTGRIAYVAVREGSRDLLVVDAASNDTSALDAASRSASWAQWSPDGSRLASVLEAPGPRSTIVVSRADGSDPVTIVDEQDTGAVGPDLLNLSWSPDGTQIAFSGRTQRRGVARRTIIIVNADGSGRPTVLDGLWVWVSWSHDGRRLLVAGFPDSEAKAARFDLYTVRPDGSGLVQLTDDQPEEHSPSWSPDGGRIVFSEGGDYDQDVYVMDADGSDVHKLTDWGGFDGVPVWSPDGAWIAFTSDRGATPRQQEVNRTGEGVSGFEIYVMRPDGSDVRRFLGEDGSLLYPMSWVR
ncbi:MAG: TolB family protein [Actinomycetota bacterium]